MLDSEKQHGTRPADSAAEGLARFYQPKDVIVRGLVDWLAFSLSFIFGTWLRFQDETSTEWLSQLKEYLPSIIAGAFVFVSVNYILGLYSPDGAKDSTSKRALILAAGFIGVIGVMTGFFYVNFSVRVGRGVMAISCLIAYVSILTHHYFIRRKLSKYRPRTVLIATSLVDQLEIASNLPTWEKYLNIIGYVHRKGFVPSGELPNLGEVENLEGIVGKHQIERVLCTQKSLSDTMFTKTFSQLRYSGITVTPLHMLYEETHATIPLELITPEWLLSASSAPTMFYIKKIKRVFDVASSLACLTILSPVLLTAMVAVKLTSRGPIFYHQTRVGRFGRNFKIVKLRSMIVDAEKEGAVWSQKNDPRVTKVGNFLRKYRIDEIPQFFNVLKGQMSLVGPRPERPEFVDELAQQIPYYKERLMIQPGLTGWAQVRYPYGSTVEDAWRKTEFDLFYLKHMGLVLDIGILLRTIWVVISGGLDGENRSTEPIYNPSPTRLAARPSIIQPSSSSR
jgi:exopolysaccharide biosynthesis polyprenyl glycosylphosphotransferase